jgi:hypothetical protein
LIVQLDSSTEDPDNNIRKPDIIIFPYNNHKAYPIYIIEATKISKFDKETLTSNLKIGYLNRDY